MTEIKINISIKCRACLSEETEMYDLFDNLGELQDNLTLAKVLENTTCVKINKDDGLSTYLCKKCAELIVDFQNFKFMFIENERYLKSLLPNNDIQVDHTPPVTSSPNSSPREDNIKYEILEHDLEEVKPEPCLEEIIFQADRTSTVYTGNNSTHQNQKYKPQQLSVLDQIENIKEQTQYFCVLCGNTFQHEDTFRHHISSGHNLTVDDLDCSQYSVSIFKTPPATIEVITQTECTRCNIVFESGEELVAHNKTHRNHVCQICGAAFTKSSILADHKIIHETSARYVCPMCGKAFRRRFQFAIHKRAHTNPGAFKCEKCGKAFNSNQQLKSHFQLIHIRTRPYLCNLCGLTFPLRSTLRTHQKRKHTLEVGATRESFQCQFCDMVYKNKTTLTRHIGTKHNGNREKPRCHLCDKEFSDDNNVRKHLLLGRCREDLSNRGRKLVIKEKKKPVERVKIRK